MIGPKVAKPSKADERDAYELATLRDNDTCQMCLRNCGPIARDHRQNRQPGNTILANLQCLGLPCHLWKTEHHDDAIAEGWGVPGWTNADPREWPARRWLRTTTGTLRLGWVIYFNAPTSGPKWFTEITETLAFARMRSMGWGA